MKPSIYFTCFAALALACLPSINAEPANMISEIKKVVSFIYVPTVNGDIANGTAFFVMIPSEKQKDESFIYLVTAKHVIEKDTLSKVLWDEIKVRINRIDGSSELFVLPLTGPNAVQVYTHENPGVDIAVIPIVFKTVAEFDIKAIPDSLLVTKESFAKLKISEGDDVFFSGLFTPFPGAKKNIPILRFGKVAMISDEKIPWNNQMLDLYLMETQSFGGNSGAPVFFNLSPSREPGQIVIGPPQLFLAGIMMGAFQNFSQLVIVNQSAIPISRENTGIAAVVPSYLLHEILFGESARKARNE